LRESKGEK